MASLQRERGLVDMADVPTEREPVGRDGNQGPALHGIDSGRARGPTRKEGAVRSRGRRGAVEEPLVGGHRLEAPVATGVTVTVEVAGTAISARIRRTAAMPRP